MEALDGLSALSLAGLPTISKHQEEIERATMTDEERVAALTDVFGEYCALDIRQNKRSKCDLGPEEIEFLLQQMSMELELIPASRKQALLYAQTVCNIDEFSAQRLEKFLRCEGMNPKVRVSYDWLTLVLFPRSNVRLSHHHLCDFLYAAGSTAVCKLLGVPAQSLWTRQVCYAHDIARSAAR